MSRLCWDAGRVYNLIWGVKVVTKATTAQPGHSARWRRLAIWSVALWACFLSGCASWPWQKTDDLPGGGARDSFILRGRGLERDKVADDKLQAQLDNAKRLYQKQEYKKAEPIFAKLASNNKNPVNLAEEARYFEADCQYMVGNLRDASGTFKSYFKEFRNGNYQEQANRRMFDIAEYWLVDTRKEMEAYEELREGKRWLVMPASFIHFGKDMPALDREGHAVGLLQDIYINDALGPVGEKALFYLATVKFFREDYKEADFYYKQLYEKFPNSPLAPKAIKQSIICKQVCNHGPLYDGREVESSRKLIDTAVRAYPQLRKDEEWMQRQLVAINAQQAERDFNIAKFYERTGHPGSAYFYYELVKRRYPNQKVAAQASERMAELRTKVDSQRMDAANGTNGGIFDRLVNPRNDPSQAPRILPPSFANTPGP